jgi:hypothetical protein
MAQQIRFRLDGTVYGGIANPMDFGVTIAEEPTLQYRFVSFDNDIKFIGDGYAYLNNLIESDCGCDLVSVDVEYLCGQTSWQRLCTGFIILAECVTNYDKCEITTKLFDNTFATLINNNKAIPFSLRSELTKNLQAVVPPSYFSVNLFVPATGVYIIDPADLLYGIRVEDAFTQLVSCMTDNRVDVSAPAFASGTFENLMVMNGRQIKTNSPVETVISFEQLFVALNRKINISLSSTLQANGRPLLTIDFTSNINNQASTIDLVSLSGVTRKQETARIYSTVNFGNQEYYEQWQCNNGDNACTFAQTPFKGFRDETFGLLGNCNKNVELDLLVQDVIFDTNIIEDVYVWGNQSFDNNPFLINCGNVLATVRFALQGDPYSIGQTVYNADFTNEETAQYWVGGIPNSLQIYIEGFNPVNTLFSYDSNAIPNQSFSIVFPQFTSYSQINGTFIEFAAAATASPYFIDDTTYKVPYSGVYTFQSLIVLEDLGATPDSRACFASILRYNSQDEFIEQIDGSITTALNIDRTFVLVVAQLVCEVGDLIRADCSVALLSAGSPLTQEILNTATISSIDYTTNFGGSGQPFEPSQLQPYDPCDYKNYLYDFEAPLSMDKIQLMLNNPSAPIKFSRTPTINNGITGLCNQVTIDSIIRQNASFTLRSSQKL